jgi:hypothetical protein
MSPLFLEKGGKLFKERLLFFSRFIVSGNKSKTQKLDQEAGAEIG